MPEDRTHHDVLARITKRRQLARTVSQLEPETLHALIREQGLQDCGELLALATPQQLSVVFDLDLWTADRPGADEHFDAARFCEWLEVLVDAGAEIAATQLAAMDVALVVAGLSTHVTVWDLAVFSPVVEESGADAVANAGRERGLHAEIGGYLVVARTTDAWDPVVNALLALDAYKPDTFHRVMRACRRLSNSGREIDGLDDLLPVNEQSQFDLSLSREQRRDRLGFLPPPQARTFLASARLISTECEQPSDDPVFVGYRRAVDAPGGAALATRSDDARGVARMQEIGFLANALMAGCSVQGRAFTPREATEAVEATCTLGREYWPRTWPASSREMLVPVFQVGWAVLYRDVSMAAADRLLDALAHLRANDRDLELGLGRLRRELRKQRQAGTPWRARDQLEALAPLDLPTWAALTALFDECPVMLANVAPSNGKRPHAVNPSEFQFIADPTHVASVRRFLVSLMDLLTGGVEAEPC